MARPKDLFGCFSKHLLYMYCVCASEPIWWGAACKGCPVFQWSYIAPAYLGPFCFCFFGFQILDDGGDATHLMLQKFPGTAKYMKGVVEDTVTGIHRSVSQCVCVCVCVSKLARLCSSFIVLFLCPLMLFHWLQWYHLCTLKLSVFSLTLQIVSAVQGRQATHACYQHPWFRSQSECICPTWCLCPLLSGWPFDPFQTKFDNLYSCRESVIDRYATPCCLYMWQLRFPVVEIFWLVVAVWNGPWTSCLAGRWCACVAMER